MPVFFELAAAGSGSFGFSEIPEGALEPDVVEQLLDVVLFRALPVTIETAGIPSLRQFPALLYRNCIPGFHIHSRQPVAQMLLRTEGKDRRSGVSDVFPKIGCRNDKMDNPVGRHRLPMADGHG